MPTELSVKTDPLISTGPLRKRMPPVLLRKSVSLTASLVKWLCSPHVAYSIRQWLNMLPSACSRSISSQAAASFLWVEEKIIRPSRSPDAIIRPLTVSPAPSAKSTRERWGYSERCPRRNRHRFAYGNVAAPGNAGVDDRKWPGEKERCSGRLTRVAPSPW